MQSAISHSWEFGGWYRRVPYGTLGRERVKFLIIKTRLFQQRTNYSLFKFSGHDRGLQRQINNFPDHWAKEIKTTKEYSRGDRVKFTRL